LEMCSKKSLELLRINVAVESATSGALPCKQARARLKGKQDGAIWFKRKLKCR
jgi:hypothetical protein